MYSVPITRLTSTSTEDNTKGTEHMDATTLRSFVDNHLASLKGSDVDSIEQDFIADLRPHVAGIVATLPAPLSIAENLSLEVDGSTATVTNRLVGDDGATVVMRSQWIESDGRPRIISGAPVQE